jgi:cysteine desulfurase
VPGEIYLDHNATTPLRREVRAAMEEAWGCYGNPSSVHQAGRRARDLVERARAQVATLLGASPDEIVFCSGGTEACALALGATKGPVVTSPLEHPAVLGAAAGRVRFVRVGADGRVDPDEVRRALSGAGLVSVQWANHEVGNLNSVAEIASVCREAGVAMHSDAVQAAGKTAIDLAAVPVDLLSLSAHKINGPKGVGALFVRRGFPYEPPVAGGHQERGRRPGTENVAGIVGMGAACEMARRELLPRRREVSRLGARFEAGLLALGVRRHGDRERGLAGTLNVAFPGVGGEALVQALDLEGVRASTGAACTSGSLAPSPVLLAMGMPEKEAREAVRFSVGPENTEEEIDRVLATLPGLIDRIRRHDPS